MVGYESPVSHHSSISVGSATLHISLVICFSCFDDLYDGDCNSFLSYLHGLVIGPIKSCIRAL